MAAVKKESEFVGENETTASSTLMKQRKRKEKEEEEEEEEEELYDGGGKTSGVVFRCIRRRDSPEGENVDDALASYCSGNGFVDLAEDEEEETRSRKKRRVMVNETEVEEYFAATKKDLLIQFSKKYNFDFEKEEALDGRYEWVKSKP